MTATLTGVQVAGNNVTVGASMSIELPSTANLASISVKLTADAGSTITFGGTTVTSGTAFTADFSGGAATIVVTQDEASNTYTLTVTKGTWDDVQDVSGASITKVGWFSAKEFKGDLDTYASGGITIPLGSFKPKYVVNIMITEGFTGEFIFSTGKLKVYKGGSEATKAQLKTATYSMILME